MAGFAVATAAATMVGQALGMRDPNRAKRAAYLNYAVGGGFMTLCGICFIFFGQIPARWLSGNAEVAALTQAASGTDYLAIKEQIEKLDHVSADFARRVMDRGIERALKGHSVGEFDQGEMSPHARKAYEALEERASPATGGARSAQHSTDK